MDYTWLDIIIILVFFLNIALGVARGLLREIISIISLIIALVVTIRFTVPLSDFLVGSNGFKDVVLAFSTFTHLTVIGQLSLVTFGVGFVLLFVGTYCIGEAINYYAGPASTFVFFPFMSILDRIVAGVAGFIRGYVFCLVLILTLGLTPVSRDEGWTKSSLIPSLMPKASELGARVRPGGFPVWS